MGTNKTSRMSSKSSSGCKYKVKFKGKTLQIGQAGAKDFTKGASRDAKRRYLRRHAAREDWRDPTTKGYWARWLLWDKPSLAAAVEKQQKLHNFTFKKC